METYKFDYGDTVYVIESNFKNTLVSVVGMRTIENSNELDTYILKGEFKTQIGDKLYTVEFDNGESMEIPEKYLKKDE